MNDVYVAKFSGGRSSALMVRLLLEKGKQLDHIVFCNTGLESPATYDFIAAVNEDWFDNRLVMLEYTGENTYKQVGRIEDLDRTGAPMTRTVEFQQHLPSRKYRLCTRVIKLRTAFRYLYEKHNYKETIFQSFVGLRADEPRRVARLRESNEVVEARLNDGKRQLKWTDLVYAPLSDWGIDRAAVLKAFKVRPLKGLSFDPSDPDVRLSNCLGCHFSNDAEKLDIVRREPWFADYWDKLERDHYAAHKDRLDGTIGPQRRVAANKRGIEELDDYEANGWSINEVPWSLYKRMAKMKGFIPIQPSLRYAGGCEDGVCGVDI